MSNQLINSAFIKGIIAAALCEIPFAGIASIILGRIGLNQLKQGLAMAQANGEVVSGKRIPAKILGMIGFIGGIVMTAVWGLYFIIIIAVITSY